MLVTVFVLSIAFFVGTYFVLPLLLENLVARSLQTGLGLAEPPEVELTGVRRQACLPAISRGGA